MSRAKPSSPKGNAKPKSSRELQKLQALYEESRIRYNESPLSKTISSMLRSKQQRVQLTKAVSLGLGSLTSANQSRRIKQLAVFMAITSQVSAMQKTPTILYAQDPTFTKVDEMFLESLGINILRTTSPSSLGEAQHYIDRETLLYTPFLTIEAYRSVLESRDIGLLVCDDFDALRLKWPKFTDEYETVAGLLRRDLRRYSRRGINLGSADKERNGDSFWEDEDKVFPMALYWRLQERLPQRRETNQLERTISARL
jgi:hypothetical protein